VTAYPRLFAPGRIGARGLRNRILMAPMEKSLALPTGAVTPRYIDYCEARAAGGAALLLLESMYVHPAGQNHRHQLCIHDDTLVHGLSPPGGRVPPPRTAFEATHGGAALGHRL
jgi:2,4-dienoyl-CoA reductase-like NADH-dependent reductase (Old Yellow Enzyme family)